MMNRNKINELLRRYDEALTTDAEERELAEFFRSTTDIPDEWADYAVLFNALDSTDSLFSDEEVAVAPKTARIVAHKKWLWAAAVAALVVVAGGGLLRLNQLTKENAELIAENEARAVEIRQETASDGSIFTKKLTEKSIKSVSDGKMMAKAEKKGVEEKETEEKGVEEKEKEIIAVSGSVISSEDGEPVVGATVLVVGTKIGAATDVDGNFSLRCPKGSQLHVSYVGMYPTVVEAQPSLNIALAPDHSGLDKIIVVGYGKQEKTEKTGSVQPIRIRGNGSQKDGKPLILLNGEEFSDFSPELLENGTVDDLVGFLRLQKWRLIGINIWKDDEKLEKYRQKFGDRVNHGVIEFTAVPIEY